MDIDIFQLPGIMKRRLHYIVLSVIACVLLAAAYLSTLTPLYQASADLLLDPQGLMADRRDLFVSGASPQEQPSLESQAYIVQSREVVNEVVTSLSLDRDAYFSKAAKTPAGASAETRLAAIGAAVLKHLRVERAGQSFILSITAQHPDAVRAAELANAFAATYLKKTADARSDATRRASESFQAQAGELRDRVLRAEMAVEEFRAANGLASVGEQGLLIDQQVSGINEQLTQARVAEDQQRANYEQARNLTVAAIEAGAIPEVAQSQAIETLRSRYTQLLEREAELATGLGASHPQMRAVRSQIAGVRQSIDAEIGRVRETMRVNYERAAANARAIEDQLSKLTQTSYDSGAALTRMRQLESEAEAVRAIYKTFLTRAEELGQTQGLNTNNSHVISAAVPPASAPGGLKKVVLVAALLFGVALGSALAVLRELLAGGLGSERELVSRTGLPVVAHLPAAPPARQGWRQRFLSRLPGSSADRASAEYRRKRELGMLRTVHLILNTLGDRLPATVLLVSPGEKPPEPGFAAEIAETLAGLQQEVAFAPGTPAERPAAFRRPAPARGRSMLAAAAVSEYDVEEELPLANLLHYERFPAHGRGKLIHAGRTAALPADIVLIDAGGTQAAEYLPALLKTADAVLVVSALAGTRRADVSELMLAIEPFGEKILGQVVIGNGA